MTCGHPVADGLPFYLNDTLGEDERGRVERHLATCRACRDELAMWGEVSARVRADGEALPAISARQLTRLVRQSRAPGQA